MLKLRDLITLQYCFSSHISLYYNSSIGRLSGLCYRVYLERGYYRQSIASLKVSILQPENNNCIHLAQRSPEVSNIFPDNFFNNLVKMSKKMCNLGSLVFFTTPNKQPGCFVCNIVLKPI